MKLTRVALLSLIYSYMLFLGTPLLILVFQTAAILATGAGILYLAVNAKSSIFPLAIWASLILLAFYLVVALTIGLERGQTPPALMGRYLLTFVTTISLPLFAHASIRLGIFSPLNLLWHVALAACIYSFFKLAIVALFLVFDIPPQALVLGFQAIFNTAPTLGVIVFNIIRFMSPTDFAIPMLLYFSVVYTIGPTRSLFSTVFVVSIFLSYSRYIWLETLIVLGMLFLRTPRKFRLMSLAAMVIAMPLLATYVPSIPFIQERFSSGDSRSSDSLRTKQFDALTSDMAEHLLFGHGLASFSFQVIRDKGTPYSYEEQWVAIFYQLGLFGILIVLSLITVNCVPLFEAPFRDFISIFGVYAAFLMSGFANPSLLGRAAGVGFLGIACLSMIARNQTQNASSGRPILMVGGYTPSAHKGYSG